MYSRHSRRKHWPEWLHASTDGYFYLQEENQIFLMHGLYEMYIIWIKMWHFTEREIAGQFVIMLLDLSGVSTDLSNGFIVHRYDFLLDSPTLY